MKKHKNYSLKRFFKLKTQISSYKLSLFVVFPFYVWLQLQKLNTSISEKKKETFIWKKKLKSAPIITVCYFEQL